MGAVYRRRTARFACGRYERTRRSYWFGLGWDGDRVGRTWQYLYAPCRGTWHRPGAPAPRRRDWFRNTRQPAAQRRCRDVAIRLWDNPPRKLSRHRDGRSRQCDHSTRSGDRAGFSVWIVLTALLIYLEKSPIQAFVNSFEIANAREKKYEEVCRVTSSDFCIRWIDSSEMSSLSHAHFPTCSDGLVKQICVCRRTGDVRSHQLCRPGRYCHTFDGACRQ